MLKYIIFYLLLFFKIYFISILYFIYTQNYFKIDKMYKRFKHCIQNTMFKIYLKDLVRLLKDS